MVSGSFDTGLTSMASYIGNVILPVCAGLTLCVGIYQLAHHARAGERYVTAAVACLSASGFVRLAEYFSTQNSSCLLYTSGCFWLGLASRVALYTAFLSAKGQRIL